MQQLDATKLCDEFQASIRFDSHQVSTRTSRSIAGKEIRRRGAAILSDVGSFLRSYQWPSHCPEWDDDVKSAWGLLLSWLADELRLPGAPASQRDFESWVAWAEESPKRTTADGYCFKAGCCKEVPAERPNLFYCSDECMKEAWRAHHKGQPEPDWSKVVNGRQRIPPAAPY